MLEFLILSWTIKSSEEASIPLTTQDESDHDVIKVGGHPLPARPGPKSGDAVFLFDPVDFQGDFHLVGYQDTYDF